MSTSIVIFFEHLKHAHMSEAARRARGENEPNLAPAHLATQPTKVPRKLSRIAAPQVAMNWALERLLDIAAQPVSILQALQKDKGLDGDRLDARARPLRGKADSIRIDSLRPDEGSDKRSSCDAMISMSASIASSCGASTITCANWLLARSSTPVSARRNASSPGP